MLAGADLAIDGGELTGLPSTVVDIAAIDDDGGWQILRQGALSAGDLASSPRRPSVLGPRLRVIGLAESLSSRYGPVNGRRSRRREVLSCSLDSNSRCSGLTIITKAKQPRRPVALTNCLS